MDVDDVPWGRFADLTESEIGNLTTRFGRVAVPLGDVFAVRGARKSSVRIEGALALAHGLGTGLTSGEMMIDGAAGDRLGARMSNGRITVLGQAGHDAGMAMCGGVIEVRGPAGDRVGAASPGARRGMTGGEIVVHGSVGRDVALRARRGFIAIGGNAGEGLARDIIAGTVVVRGNVGPSPGTGSKRGSIVAAGSIPVPVTYRVACTYAPAFVRLVWTYLSRYFALAVEVGVVTGRYRRHCGDLGGPGRGEILEWTGER